MRPHNSRLGQAEAILVSATVVVGWSVFAAQLRNDGWISGGGTAWLLAAAVIASMGAVVAILARRADRHGWVAVGLAAVAVSPTVFAFILNAVVIIFCATELALAFQQGHARATPAR